MTINWLAFLEVFATALTAAGILVLFYSLGLRLMVTADRVPTEVDADDDEPMTHVTTAPSPAGGSTLSPTRRFAALIGAYACFAVCAIAVILGIFLLVVQD